LGEGTSHQLLTSSTSQTQQSQKSKQWAQRSFINYNALLHAHSIRQQLQQLLESSSLHIDTSLTSSPEKDPVLKCIAKGLDMNLAYLHNSIDLQQTPDQKQGKHHQRYQQQPSSHYRTVIGSQDVYIHPSSSLYLTYERNKKHLPKYLIFAEILITSKHYMRYLSILDETWIDELNLPFKRNHQTVPGQETKVGERR
jgi:hypothetical protein